MNVVDQVPSATSPVADGLSSGPDARADVGRRRRRRRRPPTLLVVFLAFAAGMVGVRAVDGVRDVTGPRAFAGRSGASTGFERGYAPGTRFSMSVVMGPLPDVTMLDSRAVFAPGSVPVATTLSVCRARPAATTVGIGLAVGDLDEWCSQLVPVRGADLGGFGERDSLVLTMVPLAEGSVHLDGLDLTYEQDGRRTTERLPAEFRAGRCSAPDGC